MPALLAARPAACHASPHISPAPAPAAAQFLGAELLNRADRNKLARQEVIREYERFPGDTGSTEVQGAPPAPRLLSCLHFAACKPGCAAATSAAVPRCAVGCACVSLDSRQTPCRAGAMLAHVGCGVRQAAPARLPPLATCAVPQGMQLLLWLPADLLCAVALLTRKIEDMAEHMRQHRKDFSSRRQAVPPVGAVPGGGCLQAELTHVALHSLPDGAGPSQHWQPSAARRCSPASRSTAACVLPLGAGALRRCCTSGASCCSTCGAPASTSMRCSFRG